MAQSPFRSPDKVRCTLCRYVPGPSMEEKDRPLGVGREARVTLPNRISVRPPLAVASRYQRSGAARLCSAFERLGRPTARDAEATERLGVDAMPCEIDYDVAPARSAAAPPCSSTVTTTTRSACGEQRTGPRPARAPAPACLSSTPSRCRSGFVAAGRPGGPGGRSGAARLRGESSEQPVAARSSAP